MLELSDKYRQALTLVAVGGLSYEEAARICKCPLGTMKSRVNRARDRLAELLAEGDLVAEPQPAGLAMAAIVASAEQYRLRVAA
jgi:RNA polymerase sigma-70 factor (ECF subfamily)